jgi:hypothetical protein
VVAASTPCPGLRDHALAGRKRKKTNDTQKIGERRLPLGGGSKKTCCHSPLIPAINEMISPELVFQKGRYKACHSCIHANPNMTITQALDILTNLQLIIRSKAITCITEHDWGASGFTQVPADMYGIPITNIKIEKEHY